jgi:hypothetical protein
MSEANNAANRTLTIKKVIEAPVKLVCAENNRREVIILHYII